MAGLGIDITGDDRRLQESLNRSIGGIQNLSRVADREGVRIEDMFRRIAIAGGITFGTAQVKGFIDSIIDVRAEMQSLESSFDVLLKGKGVSEFMSQLKQFAVESPLSLKGLANGAQTLLSFNIEAEKVMPTLKQIGDISMGNEDKFKSLTLAFAQMSSTGKLMGQDLLQMINAGFNPLSVISEKTGKSIGELKKEMESGAISSQMVADAFEQATSKGGLFYGMTQKQAEGIKGLQAQLEGGIEDILNDIGKSQEDIIAGGYKMAITLVENYEKIGKIIASMIATYGAYKTALVLTTVAENGLTIAHIAQHKWTVLVEKAQKLLNATLLKNPYVLIATLVMGVVTAMWALNDSTSEAKKAVESFNEEVRNETKELNGLFSAYKRANEGSEEKKKLLETIKSKYGDYIKSLIDEKGRITDVELAQRMANEALKESIALKIKEASIGEVTQREVKKQAESLSGIRDILAKKDGDAVANHMVSHIGEIFADESKSAKESALEAQKYLEDAGVKMNESNGFFSKAIGKHIEELQNSSQRIKNEHKIIEDSFRGIIKGEPLDIYIPTRPEDTPLSYESEYKQAKKDWETAKKELKAIDKDKDKFTTEQYNKAKERVKQTKEAFDALGGNTKDVKANNNTSNDAQKRLDDELRLANDKIKAEFDARNAKLENDQALLDQEDDSFNKRQKQAELNHQKELLAIDRRVQELVEREQDVRRKQWELDNPNAKTTYKNNISSLTDLNKDQQAEIEQREQTTNTVRLQSTAKLHKELLDMYQDYNAQRESINKKFGDDLVALESQESSKANDRAITELKKRWKEALSSLELSEFQEGIDWATLFGNLNEVSTKELENLRDKIREYLSKIGDSLSKEDLKTVSDALFDVELKITERKPIYELTQGYKEYKTATEEVIKAKKELEKLEKGTPEYVQAQKALSDAEKNRAKSQTKLNLAVNEVGRKGSELVNAGKELTDMLTNIGVKMPESVSGVLNGMGQIMGGLEKFDITKPFSIISSSVSVLSGLGNTVASIFGGGSKSLTQMQIDSYKNLISVLDEVIDRQKELLQGGLTKESVSYYEDALDTIQKQIEAGKKFLSVDFFESKENKSGRTYGARERRYIQEAENQRKLKALGIELKDQYDLLKLTKAEILLLQQKMPEFYNNLFEETRDYLQLIVDTEDHVIELGEALQEALTGVSFDTVKDSLDDLIKGVDTTFEQIGDSFEDNMRNAVMNFVKSQYLTGALEDWYKQFAEFSKDQSLSQSEVDELRKMYEEAYKKAQGMYDSALEVAGIDKESSDVSASSKGIASISQDSANELNGNFFALLQKTADIRNISEATRVSIGGIGKGIENMQTIMNENSKIFQDSLSVQVKIEQNTAKSAELLSKFNTEGITVRN